MPRNYRLSIKFSLSSHELFLSPPIYSCIPSGTGAR
jgi:hypothetical protein